MLARRVFIDIIYQGVNITDDLKKDLKKFSYTDNANGSADDISIELKDETRKWINSWAPTKGDYIEASINTLNWNKEGESENVAIGKYFIDKIDYKRPPSTIGIGAISSPVNGFMDETRSKTYEKSTVKNLAEYIASRNSLELFFDSKNDPVTDFIEQSETSDSEFLQDICTKYGLALKIFSQKIVIYSESEYEQRASIATLAEPDFEKYPNANLIIPLIEWSASTNLSGVGYTSCSVKYKNPSGKEVAYTFDTGKEGKKLVINESVDNIYQAELLAKSRLREYNKKEYSLSAKIKANLKLFAGACVDVENIGIFSGKYFIDKISHDIGGGYSMDLEMHRCLEGY